MKAYITVKSENRFKRLVDALHNGDPHGFIEVMRETGWYIGDYYLASMKNRYSGGDVEEWTVSYYYRDGSEVEYDVTVNVKGKRAEVWIHLYSLGVILEDLSESLSGLYSQLDDYYGSLLEVLKDTKRVLELLRDKLEARG